MIIGAVSAVCIVLFLLAFLAPRLSHHPERGAKGVFGLGARAGGSAPGPLGKLFAKPFHSASKWSGKSANKGRKGRGKLPL